MHKHFSRFPWCQKYLFSVILKGHWESHQKFTDNEPTSSKALIGPKTSIANSKSGKSTVKKQSSNYNYRLWGRNEGNANRIDKKKKYGFNCSDSYSKCKDLDRICSNHRLSGETVSGYWYCSYYLWNCGYHSSRDNYCHWHFRHFKKTETEKRNWKVLTCIEFLLNGNRNSKTMWYICRLKLNDSKLYGFQLIEEQTLEWIARSKSLRM